MGGQKGSGSAAGAYQGSTASAAAASADATVLPWATANVPRPAHVPLSTAILRLSIPPECWWSTIRPIPCAQYAQQQAFDYSQFSDPAQGFAGQAGETAAATGATGDKASGEVPNQQANMYQQFSHAGHAAYPTNNFYYPQHMTQQPAQQYSQHMAQQPNPNAYW